MKGQYNTKIEKSLRKGLPSKAGRRSYMDNVLFALCLPINTRHTGWQSSQFTETDDLKINIIKQNHGLNFSVF